MIRSLFGPLAGVIAIPLGVLSSLAAVILMWRNYRGPRDVMRKDAALTLGLIGLPAPVFFGAYYLAFLLGLTSG